MNPFAWWTQIRERRWLKGLARAGKGYAVRVWAVAPAMTTTERADQAATMRAWLARQLSATATPHGVAHYLVGIGFVHQAGQARTPLEKTSFDIPQRIDAPAVFDRAATYLATTALPASTTHVEVYLLSLGDMLKTAMPE